MQLMALRAGGRLNQYLPDTHTADVVERHRRGEHPITIDAHGGVLPRASGVIHSNHQQAIEDPGSLRVIAAADGIIEAIDNPEHPFYLGVQWHPERAPSQDEGPLNLGLFRSLVLAASG